MRTNFSNEALERTFKIGANYSVITFLYGLIRLAVLISLAVLIQHLFIALTCSLKLLGDVELNPGPYKILKSIQGSFNQGNLALFGETADRECAFDVLFSLCWSVVRDLCY